MAATAVAQTAPLTTDEARELTNKINHAGDRLVALLTEASERRIWEPLGYASWAEYAQAEIKISRSHAYRLLDHGKVERAIAEATGERVEITERTARELKPDLPEVTAEIKTRVESGESVAEAVKHTVEARKPKPAPEPDEDDGAEPATDLVAELEAAQKEIERLQAIVKSLEADDTSREILALSARAAQTNALLEQARTEASEARRQAEWAGKLIRKIMKALAVQEPKEIVPAIEALVG